MQSAFPNLCMQYKDNIAVCWLNSKVQQWWQQCCCSYLNIRNDCTLWWWIQQVHSSLHAEVTVTNISSNTVSGTHILYILEDLKGLIFSYQDGLSWHFHTLRTRKRRFQTIWRHRSLALSTVCRRIREYWQKCGCYLEKWGLVRLVTNCGYCHTSRSLRNTKVEEHSHNPAARG